MFVWFVVKQPFILNPPVWLALIWFVYAFAKSEPAPRPLEVLERQKALGDAGKATPLAAHNALTGTSPHADERFKD